MPTKSRGRRWALCAFAAILLLPAVAGVSDELPRSMRLEYHRPPGKTCPGPEELKDLVDAEAFRDVFDAAAPALLWVSITHRAGRYEAAFEVRDGAGAVVFTEPVEPQGTCEHAVENVAFQAGVMLKILPAPPPPSPPPPPQSPSPPVPPALPSAKDAPAPAATKVSGPWALRGAVSGGVGLGVSPATAAGVFTLELGGQRKRSTNLVLSGTLGVLWIPHRSALKSVEMSPAEVEVGTTLLSAVASPCVHGRVGFPWLFGCLGLEIGGMDWEGAQIRHPASAWTVWAALDPRLGIEVPLTAHPRPDVPQFALRAFGDLPVPLVRPEGVVGVGPSMSSGRIVQIVKAPPVGATFNLGLTVWFDL